MPGNHGGGQYGAGAADPNKGLLYVTSVEAPAIMKLVPRKAPVRVAAPVVAAPAAARGPSVAGALDSDGPPQRPGQTPLPVDPARPEDPNVWSMRVDGSRFINAPYGFMYDGNGQGAGEPAVRVKSYLVAYDMNQGKQLWRVPFGNSPVAEAAGRKDTGLVMQKRTISLTATGLLLSIVADSKFRAYDAATGATLMERPVSGTGAGIPAIYQVKGKQYVLLALSAGPSTAGRTGAGGGAYVAYALGK
jgi:quinoprotein glucose dehydrogenase